MTLQDVLQEAKELSIADRRELIKLLVDTLVEVGAPPVRVDQAAEHFLGANVAHEVWSPYDSFKAARQLQEMLDEYRRGHAGS